MKFETTSRRTTHTAMMPANRKVRCRALASGQKKNSGNTQNIPWNSSDARNHADPVALFFRGAVLQEIAVAQVKLHGMATQRTDEPAHDGGHRHPVQRHEAHQQGKHGHDGREVHLVAQEDFKQTALPRQR